MLVGSILLKGKGNQFSLLNNTGMHGTIPIKIFSKIYIYKKLVIIPSRNCFYLLINTRPYLGTTLSRLLCSLEINSFSRTNLLMGQETYFPWTNWEGCTIYANLCPSIYSSLDLVQTFRKVLNFSYVTKL